MWTCFIFRYRYRSVVTTVSGSEKFRAISVWKIFLPADELLHVFLDFGFWSLQWSHHVSSLLERWILCHFIFKWRKTSLRSQRGRKRRGWEHRFLFLLLWSIQIDYVHIFNVTRSSLTVASFGAKKKKKRGGGRMTFRRRHCRLLPECIMAALNISDGTNELREALLAE